MEHHHFSWVFMGKSTVNHNFQAFFVCLPWPVPWPTAVAGSGATGRGNPVENTLGQARDFSRQRLVLVRWCAIGQAGAVGSAELY